MIYLITSLRSQVLNKLEVEEECSQAVKLKACSQANLSMVRDSDFYGA